MRLEAEFSAEEALRAAIKLAELLPLKSGVFGVNFVDVVGV